VYHRCKRGVGPGERVMKVADDRDKDRRWTQPGVLQGKADEVAGERDKDHQWTRSGQSSREATGDGCNTGGPGQVDPRKRQAGMELTLRFRIECAVVVYLCVRHRHSRIAARAATTGGRARCHGLLYIQCGCVM
jgi:hypothetical protein